MSREADSPDAPQIDLFVDGRTESPSDWRWLWEGDHEFPVQSHRGRFGGLVVRLKRWFRPVVKTPQNDLWERQRRFNLVVVSALERLAESQRRIDELHRDLSEVRSDLLKDVKQHAKRLGHLEEFKRQGLDDVTHHSDALFARVDQKFDRYRRESRHLWSRVGSLLAAVESGDTAQVVREHSESEYVELERRFRGLETDIAERLSIYEPYLRDRGEVLDLGCGRGESLEVFAEQGVPARGTDSSAEMVKACVEKGLRAEQGDLFDALSSTEPESLGGVVSFHVVEHLPATELERLVRLAWGALRPGGVLILETPNPLSLVVAARNFWLDPTHQKPVHPDLLQLYYEQSGFEAVERLDLRPFAEETRLPEIDASSLDGELQVVAHRVNELRDALDAMLFGYQDYAMIGVKPQPSGLG